MDEDHILGYIDMRRVVNVREGDRTVSLDASRSAIAGLMHKMRGMMGSSTLDKVTRPVVELVTTTRTYVLCPASIESPPPVPAAAATGPSLYGKPLYLFGWPFPVPHLEGAVMSHPDNGGDDEHAVAVSQSEAQEAAQLLFSSSDTSGVSQKLSRIAADRLANRTLKGLTPLLPLRNIFVLLTNCSATFSSRGEMCSQTSSRMKRRRAYFPSFFSSTTRARSRSAPFFASRHRKSQLSTSTTRMFAISPS